ncbi:MAG: HdeD family acid-resistance protein [Spirochaetales bacterium]
MIFSRSPWWFGIVRGTLAVAVGVIALVWPELTATTLIIVFAGVLLLDGLIGVVAGIGNRLHSQQQAAGVLQAFVAILLGLIGVLAPAFSLRLFSITVALWAIGTGIISMFVAGTLGRLFRLGPLLGLLGLASLVLGGIILFSPRAGVVLVATLTGANAIIFGLGRIAFGLRQRRAPAGQVHGRAGASRGPAGPFSGTLGEPELRGQSDVSDAEVTREEDEERTD